MHVTERSEEVGGLAVHLREAPPVGDATPLYLHGVPSDGDDWLPVLQRTGGLAPDLPGFGRSDKPAEFDYSIAGYARFLERLLDARGIDRVTLLVHDWGAVGLAMAQRRPDRIDRLVITNAVPFLPGYRWHLWARTWRRRVVGELAMGFSSRMLMRRELRRAMPDARPAADEVVDRAWRRFDHGTQRAILKLYRSAPPDVLADAGAGLAGIRCPALVLWGDADPFIPRAFADAYGSALGGATTVEHLDGVGHWPWLERPELVERVSAFVLGGGQ